MDEHTLALASFVISTITCALNIGLIVYVWRKDD